MTDNPMDDVGGSGYSIDDLSAYLDRGRTPAIAAIDTNPQCQAMLDSLQRVGAMSLELLEDDAIKGPPLDESWLGSLLDTIGREVRAGRDVPLASTDPRATLSVTEGALRELVRAAGDSVPGVLVGRCELVGDIEDAEAAITVNLTISVVLSAPVVELAHQGRERVYTELLRHTQLRVTAIDIAVNDAHQLTVSTNEEPS